jgi:cytochrome c5
MKTIITSQLTKILGGPLLLAISVLLLPGTVIANDAGDAIKGAQAWANTCSRCHNMRQPNEFTDDKWDPIINHMRLRSGIPGDMARDIRAFLQSSNYSALKVNASPKPGSASNVALSSDKTAQSGKAVFDSTCIACHGANGKGTIPGVPTLQSRLSQSGDVLLQHIKDGFQSEGSVMIMPPRGGNPALTDTELSNVLTYMREQFGR